jgi:hypothetical protein
MRGGRGDAASRRHLNMDLTGLWVQHYAEHLYSTEDRYEMTDAAVSRHWNNFYAGPLQDLQEVVEQGRIETERPNVVAMGTILRAGSSRWSRTCGATPATPRRCAAAISRRTDREYDPQQVYDGHPR